MIEHSSDITKIATALHAAQGSLSVVVKDAKNPAFKSRYATLEAVIDAAKPALQSAGIAFTQAPGALIDGALEVTTMLIHAESGQWMRSTLHVPLGKRDPQGVGSAITYACRYSLMAALGLPPADDDAEGAMDRNTSKADSSAQAYRTAFLAKINAGDLDAVRGMWAADAHMRDALGITEGHPFHRELHQAWLARGKALAAAQTATERNAA